MSKKNSHNALVRIATRELYTFLCLSSKPIPLFSFLVLDPLFPLEMGNFVYLIHFMLHILAFPPHITIVHHFRW